MGDGNIMIAERIIEEEGEMPAAMSMRRRRMRRRMMAARAKNGSHSKKTRKQKEKKKKTMMICSNTAMFLPCNNRRRRRHHHLLRQTEHLPQSKSIPPKRNERPFITCSPPPRQPRRRGNYRMRLWTMPGCSTRRVAPVLPMATVSWMTHPFSMCERRSSQRETMLPWTDEGGNKDNEEGGTTTTIRRMEAFPERRRGGMP
mmetsp:Transcript_9594/g.20751  ORF Transcript_9594/g.20751 Transcript_9594/m.20751 type:complete len:201 (+) Transcript_9594:820-1422(+)